MTYCVAVRVADGLVMLSDTRTNAGIDNVSRFSKMFIWEQPGERAIGMMCSGNLSITQGVMTRLKQAIEASAFTVESVEHGEVPKAPKFERPMIVGSARR